MNEVFLVVGLGNPGREYSATRHNIGFRIADHLAKTLGVRFSRQQNHALIASGNRGEAKLVLAKPQTYMNLSGQSVAGLLRFNKVPPEHLLVCCDDIDLPFGALRVRASGSSAGQRGMQSILDSLCTKEVPRLRFGVGRPPGRTDAADYVLQEFGPEEEEALPPIIDRAVQAILTFLDYSLEEAMNRYNAVPNSAPSPPGDDEGA
jgi:PTH1 family peptidyl-tRNA hydrolase